MGVRTNIRMPVSGEKGLQLAIEAAKSSKRSRLIELTGRLAGTDPHKFLKSSRYIRDHVTYDGEGDFYTVHP